MKKKLLSIITCVMITAVMITTSINAKALSAGATYTAYEIISMIFAVVGGTTIEQTSGLVGGSSFNANGLYESMNAQSAGVGTLLSSYVNRAQYLNPGSDLLISENDYEQFLQYFKDYNMQSTISGQIDSDSVQDFESKLEAFTGISVDDIPQTIINKINSGEYTHIVRFDTSQSGNPAFVLCGDYTIEFSAETSYAKLYTLICYSNYCYYRSYWADNQTPNNYVTVWNNYDAVSILGGTGYKADPITNGKIKNGTYDTISKSRTWDATQGKLKGPVTLTMPATSTLSDVLERENVKDITDAVNVYPTDTADDSMIYYPTQSVPDFIVPTITVNPAITFPGIDGGISDYTIELRNFFPFCIPWDIYDMLSAFVTTPVTPEFTFQFPTGVINHQIQWTECTFDLHAWDGVAQGLRTLELIAFAVGLALMTRNIFLRG